MDPRIGHGNENSIGHEAKKVIKELMDQRDKRQHFRHLVYAKAVIDDIPYYLRDVSADGMMLDSLVYVDLQVNQHLNVSIVPVETDQFTSFTLSAQVRWVRPLDFYWEVGMKIRHEYVVGRDYAQFTQLLAYMELVSSQDVIK